MTWRLNLGCGDRYADGWTNVDWGSPHTVDMKVDLRGDLPWQPESVSQVYAGHLLEHLTYDECMALAERLLPCMRPDGILVAVGPDIPVAEQMIADGTFDFTYHNLDSLKHGAGRWAGDVHQWETSGPLVAKLFMEAGWPAVIHFGIVGLESGWPVADPTQLWQYVVKAWMSDGGSE